MVGSQAGRDPSSLREHGWAEQRGTGGGGDVCQDRLAPNKTCALCMGKELPCPAAGWDGTLEHQPCGDTTCKAMCKPLEG